MRWDYNTLAELQELGYDFTDPGFVKAVIGKPPTLKMLRAFACAALISGSETGETFTPHQVGRVVTEDGDGSDVFEKVSELMRLAHGEDDELPLPASPEANA
jgi:hypothetical protein